MGEKKMQILGPGNINTLVRKAQELNIKKEDVVQFIQLPNGFVLIYFSDGRE